MKNDIDKCNNGDSREKCGDVACQWILVRIGAKVWVNTNCKKHFLDKVPGNDILTIISRDEAIVQLVLNT